MPARRRPIAQVPFVDGVVRAVYEESDSRQLVLGDDGKRVHGVWVLPPDEPQEVQHDASRRGPRDRRPHGAG
jgi:hypothetical protein